VLPNALGAELFLIVDKATLAPTALELNGGCAYSIKYYATLVGLVEESLREAVKLRKPRQTGRQWREVFQCIPIRHAAFARILVVGNDVTFLYFSEETTPVMRGRRVDLAQQDDREICFYIDGDEIVCFDGWVRVEITRTERTLVALPKPAVQ